MHVGLSSDIAIFNRLENDVTLLAALALPLRAVERCTTIGAKRSFAATQILFVSSHRQIPKQSRRYSTDTTQSRDVCVSISKPEGMHIVPSRHRRYWSKVKEEEEDFCHLRTITPDCTKVPGDNCISCEDTAATHTRRINASVVSWFSALFQV